MFVSRRESIRPLMGNKKEQGQNARVGAGSAHPQEDKNTSHYRKPLQWKCTSSLRDRQPRRTPGGGQRHRQGKTSATGSGHSETPAGGGPTATPCEAQGRDYGREEVRQRRHRVHQSKLQIGDRVAPISNAVRKVIGNGSATFGRGGEAVDIPKVLW